MRNWMGDKIRCSDKEAKKEKLKILIKMGG